MYKYCINSPAGFGKKYIHITATDKGVESILFFDEEIEDKNKNEIIDDCIDELNRYFDQQLEIFTVPIDIKGTAFQKRVWSELIKIPYGTVVSYQDLAINLGSNNYCRAVGMANSKNPISILVPCHRVIGKSGKLVGYTGGLDIKNWLINHELKKRGHE